MKILVLGAGGQLGRELSRTLRRDGHEVTALDRRALDVKDQPAVAAAVNGGGYQRVVNCAAYTKVDQAEVEVDLAFAINRDGAKHVGLACAQAGVALCHVSTDFVFTQEPPDPPRPWTESDTPHPRGVYAESKRAGELACLALGGPLYLVRTSWLYGVTGPNFPLSICRAAATGGRLRVVADQLGCPTWTGDLAPALGLLLEGEEFGVYHLTGSGATTWFHFAEMVLREVGIEAEVLPTTTAEWGAAAPRPRYSVLDNGHWRALGLEPLPAWQQGLRGYVAVEREGALAAYAKPGGGA
ncbi:MAG TPA: dTDP-4-dehydrorhamnose reductase [Candidatus Dormibacteraeota bacterium]|nr:dTDP-4-dehydrorhamnose reductase [Candidatus Dormibacteraeota bacterium]